VKYKVEFLPLIKNMFPFEFNYLLCFQGARSEELMGFETGSVATH
jgi:hypothetical protein